MNWIRIGLLLLSISTAACAASPREAPAPDESEPHKIIYLVSHGWHGSATEPKTFGVEAAPWGTTNLNRGPPASAP